MIGDIVPLPVDGDVSPENNPIGFATIEFAALARHLRVHDRVSAEDLIGALLNTVMSVGYNCDVPVDLVARSAHALAGSAPAIYARLRDAEANRQRPS